MAITHLRWLYSAFLFAAPLIVIAGTSVSTTLSPTTTFFRNPPPTRGGSISGFTNVTPLQITNGGSMSGGGRAGITITGMEVKPPPAGLKASWNTQAVKEALKKGLKATKGNLYLIAGTFALSYVLDKSGWLNDDDVLSYQDDLDDILLDVNESVRVNIAGYQDIKYSSPAQACQSQPYCASDNLCEPIFRGYSNGYPWGYCTNPKRSVNHPPWHIVKDCPPPSVMTDLGCYIPASGDVQPVTDAMIDGLDISDYQPQSSDIRFLTPFLASPTSVEWEPIPSFSSPSSTTTTINGDGSTSSTTTTQTHTISVSGGANNSPVDISTTTTTTTSTTGYKDGQSTGDTTTTTTTTTTTPTETTGETPTDTKPQPQEQPEIPTDCDLVPTLCNIQTDIRDWIKQDPALPEIYELPKVTDKDFKRDYPINIGDGQCPKPYQMNTVLAGNISLSFQPFCDFASMIKSLVIAGALMFAAYIIRSSAPWVNCYQV